MHNLNIHDTQSTVVGRHVTARCGPLRSSMTHTKSCMSLMTLRNVLPYDQSDGRSLQRNILQRKNKVRRVWVKEPAHSETNLKNRATSIIARVLNAFYITNYGPNYIYFQFWLFLDDGGGGRKRREMDRQQHWDELLVETPCG